MKSNIDILEEALELEGTETAEGWQLLVDISKYDYVFSEEFQEAIIKELQLQADNIKENYEIVEEDIVERKTKTYKRLKHKDE